MRFVLFSVLLLLYLATPTQSVPLSQVALDGAASAPATVARTEHITELPQADAPHEVAPSLNIPPVSGVQHDAPLVVNDNQHQDVANTGATSYQHDEQTTTGDVPPRLSTATSHNTIDRTQSNNAMHFEVDSATTDALSVDVQQKQYLSASVRNTDASPNDANPTKAFADQRPDTSTSDSNYVNRNVKTFDSGEEFASPVSVGASQSSNQTDAEAPSGGIASQSEQYELDEEPARDPENVHAVPPPSKVSSDVETVPVVAHQQANSADTATGVFASYAAERIRRDRQAEAEHAGVHSIERDVRIDPAAATLEAGERRKALARDPDKTWHNPPPQHLYTGYTYRPPHSWGPNMTAGAVTGTTGTASSTVKTEKSDVYEGDSANDGVSKKDVEYETAQGHRQENEREQDEDEEKKVGSLENAMDETANIVHTENEMEGKEQIPKVASVQVGTEHHGGLGDNRRHAPTAASFKMAKKGGASASMLLGAMVGMGLVIGALKLCSADDRRSLVLLRRFGRPKEHV